jgi:hypothetical protein
VTQQEIDTTYDKLVNQLLDDIFKPTTHTTTTKGVDHEAE